MILYKSIGDKLEQIKEKPFKLERDIQNLFEQNLTLIMGLELVKSEFTIKSKRIDTLAYDPQSKAFVIIEYKRDRNASVVDQGFTYLSLMLQNKADFILEYNEGLGKTLARDGVDWSQTRVIFVSTDFTENQKEATNFKDLAIELWEFKRFENGMVAISPIRKTKSAESIKPITQTNIELKQVINEIKVYTEEDLLRGKSEEVVELYEKFKLSILNLADGIEVKPQKFYIAFKMGNNNVCDFEIQKNGLKLTINIKRGNLDDPKNITRDISLVGHLGNGDYELKIADDKNLEYIMSLVKQAI
jgi:predicted transport protein